MSGIGECPICRQGELVLVEDIVKKVLLVICDDCESQWASPDEARQGAKPLTDEASAVHDVGGDSEGKSCPERFR